MKPKTMKLLSASLAVLLLGSTATLSLGASEQKTESAAKSETVPALTETEPGIAAPAKDETVYILASPDGMPDRVIVCDRLSNPDGAAALADRSNLSNIENVKGDERFSLDGESLVWQADGGEIAYRGDGSADLPVSVSITYTLNGKEISPETLAGKSGHVTIRFDYANRLTENAFINGKTEKIPVPFALVSAVILDSDVLSNVEIENGRCLNDGDRTVAVGLAFPGLADALKLDSLHLGDAELPEIPDHVTIAADAENFSLGMTLTVASNSLFADMDKDRFDLSALGEKADALTDAMEQLTDGSSRLADGLDTLYDKTGDLADGVEQLADGANSLKDGAAALHEGAVSAKEGADTLSGGIGTMKSGADALDMGAKALADGAAELDEGAKTLLDGTSALSEGLKTLNENSTGLTDGAKQVFETLLTTARDQIAAAGLDIPTLTAENYGTVLDSAAASLESEKIYQQALQTVTDAVNKQRSAIESAVTQAVRTEVEHKVAEAVREEVRAKVETAVRASVTEQVVLAAAGIDRESYEAAVSAGLVKEATQAAVSQAIEEQMRSDTVKSTVAGQTDAQMQSDDVQALVAANTDAQMQTAEVKALIVQNTESQIAKAVDDNMKGAEVQEKLAAAEFGRQSVLALKASLDGYNTFYQGVLAYTAGVASASEGADRITVGAASLRDGTKRISGGAADLESGTAQLVSGAGELMNGAQRLADGLGTLRDGSEQLSTGAAELDNGMTELSENVPALIEGVSELRNGSHDLADGLVKLDEEGISKLTDLLQQLSADRLSALIDVAKSYRTYSGLADGTDGTVKFIWRTEGIGE